MGTATLAFKLYTHTLCTLWFVYTITLYQIKPTPMVDTSWSGTRLMLWQVGDSFQPTYGRKQARTFSNPPRVGDRTELFSSIPKLLIIKIKFLCLSGTSYLLNPMMFA